jgi:O-antigen/teichoic acid export membrane protein
MSNLSEKKFMMWVRQLGQGQESALETPLKRVFRNTGWLIAAKIFGAVLSLAYLAMAAQSLGPDGFGEFTLILAIAQALAGLVSFQMWRLVLRFGTRPFQGGDVRGLRELIWRCARLDLAGAVAGCALAVPFTAWLGSRFHWSAHIQRDALLFAAIMLLSARSTAVGVLRLQDRFRAGAIASTSTPAVRFVGAAIVVTSKPSVEAFLVSWAAAEVATCVAYWLFVWKSDVMARPSADQSVVLPQSPIQRGFWRFALFTNANSTMATGAQQIALFSVGLTAGTAAAGYFRLGYQLAQALLLIAEMVSRSLYAEVESLVAKRNKPALDHLFGRATALASIGGATAVILILLLGRPALELIGGPPYLPAFPQLLVLGAAAAVQLVGISFEPALLALDQSGLVLAVRAISTLALFALLGFLLPNYGALGGGLALLGQSVLLVALLGAAVRAQRRNGLAVVSLS